MEQYYEHYMKWEDFQNGMYNISTYIESADLIDHAERLLADPIALRKAMDRAITEWPISAKVNLTNVSCNRRAWLGAAACCIEYKVPEIYTRVGWNRLAKYQQVRANEVANQIITLWEIDYSHLKQGYAQEVFRF